MEKLNVVYTYNTVLFSLKKEIVLCYRTMNLENIMLSEMSPLQKKKKKEKRILKWNDGCRESEGAGNGEVFNGYWSFSFARWKCSEDLFHHVNVQYLNITNKGKWLPRTCLQIRYPENITLPVQPEPLRSKYQTNLNWGIVSITYVLFYIATKCNIGSLAGGRNSLKIHYWKNL